MDKKIVSVLDQVIWVSFLALVTVTPLIFTTQTSELFEAPKMFFVYLGTIIIFFATLVKFAIAKKIIIPKNFVLLAFGLFVFIQLLSTITSIDKFTSIFGFPTRLNGGLLSQIAYLIIFACAQINLTSNQAKKLLAAAIISAFAVALWGIPSHFGFDPSCYVLTGQFNAACWQIDFNPTLRIFSTMGQPNWLASYLILLLPYSFAFALLYKNQKARIYFLITTAGLFLAFIFTNSRAGLLGAITAILVFVLLLGIKTISRRKNILVPAIIGLLVIFIIFGATLSSRITGLKDILFNNAQNAGPTESASIRLIVWHGAIDIFKHYPLLGTGPETFAYSYYLFRPSAHNQTTEWNFFYNKAHNEFLNYLANNGFAGFLGYLIFLTVSIFALFKFSRSANQQTSLLSKAALASLTGYQITIFFGFSTVATQLIAYSSLAFVLLQEKKNEFSIQIPLRSNSLKIALSAIIALVGIFAVSFPIRLSLADYFYTKAQKASSQEAQLLAYQTAIKTYPVSNPFYWAAFAQSLASYAQTDRDFAKVAYSASQKALAISPQNTQTIRETGQTLIDLANTDPKYTDNAISVNQKLVNLAPTDPQAFLALAKAEIVAGKNSEAQVNVEKALSLKKDYPEAAGLLDQLKAKSYNKNDTAPKN